MKGKTFLLLICLLMFLPYAAADNYTVYVVEDGSNYKFEPELIEIDIGDNVTFIWESTQFNHNVLQVEDEESTSPNGGFESEYGS